MMIAYHNNPDLKAQFVRLLEWHRAQDKIVQGSYWTDDDSVPTAFTVNGWRFTSDGRGCAVGCSIESLRIITKRADLDRDDHSAYEELIGVPRVLAQLEDNIFERLPIDEARDWPIRFAQAIPVGADLSLVWPRFAVYLLGDTDDGVIKFAKTDRQRAAIQAVIDAYLRLIEGNAPTRVEWRSYAAAAYADAAYDAYAAYAAAYAAVAYAYAAADAADAAYAAADAYAAYAAADAAYAAADAAAYAAADAYAAYAAADAARTRARQKQAAKFITLLEAA